MQVPARLRTWFVADGADDDWATLQTVPEASICIDVTTVTSLGVTFVAYEADGTTVSSGTMDFQLVDVGQVDPYQGQEQPVLITAAAVDADVPQGSGLVYDVSGCRLVTIRVADSTLDGDAFSVVIYWRALV